MGGNPSHSLPQRCKPNSNSALRTVRLMNLEPRSPLSLSIIFASCICFHFTDPRYTRRCSYKAFVFAELARDGHPFTTCAMACLCLPLYIWNLPPLS